MNCETDTNAASPGASKRPKLDMPAEADGTKAETDGAMPQDFTLSKEALLQGKAEESVVGKRIKHASASEIAALISGGAKTAADMPDDRPLQKGHKGLLIKWDRDGEYYRAEIIERRWQKDAKRWHYYVHYTDFNRRLDQWVTPDRILLKADEGMISADMEMRAQKIALIEEQSHESMEHSALVEHEKLTKLKNVNSIELGKHRVECWYYSPFAPHMLGGKENLPLECLFVCEFCLSFYPQKDYLVRHLTKCKHRHPPGDEIYRNGDIAMFEVDGHKSRIYCQNVCYLAKLFLDHKTLYYDADPFLFYIMCEVDSLGCHIVGYFSKEKVSEDGYNLACILTLPQFQRRGYGKFLISMSYELSKKEGKIGTPERPLSDLGLVTYRGYWARVLLTLLKDYKGTISIADLSKETSFMTQDIISTLQNLNLIRYHQGQHVLLLTPEQLARKLKNAGSEGLRVDPSKIHWTPYTGGRDWS